MLPRRINVRAIIYRDGQLLAQTFKNYDGTVTEWWGTPGGGLDPGESLTAGLVREVVEETGITPQVGRLLFMQHFIHHRHDGPREELEFFFHVTNPQDFESIDLSATSHGGAEIGEVAFITPAEHTVYPEFLMSIDIERYISSSQPVYLYSELPKA